MTNHPKSSFFIPRWTFLDQNNAKFDFMQLLSTSKKSERVADLNMLDIESGNTAYADFPKDVASNKKISYMQ